MVSRKIAVTIVFLAFLMPSGAAATSERGSRVTGPLLEGLQTRRPPQPRVTPTEEQRARTAMLFERNKDWMTRKLAEFAGTIGRERERFLESRKAALRSRNEKTRAEMAAHLRQADSPSARAEARRLEMREEAAELMRRSQSAQGAEQDEIQKRAAQLLEELRRIPR